MFGFCIIHILNTGCAKIWKKNRRQKVKIINFYCTSNKDSWRKSFASTKVNKCPYLHELPKQSVLNLIILGQLKACTV